MVDFLDLYFFGEAIFLGLASLRISLLYIEIPGDDLGFL
jgi:hypothetical protein